MPIEQIYCTHCTYGTSVLEQREGELAERVLGYSARAGSLDRNELRNDYRAIERFLYYYLPSDTPPEEKQRLDAANAPRRLFFCPSMGKLQMVGQVVYRQYDTAGRLGSYFAHVLFGDKSSGAWSAADCLRLWSAPWVQEDSPDHPHKLSPLERLDELWTKELQAGRPSPGPLPEGEGEGAARSQISDDAVLGFLQSSPTANGNTAVVTDRWQTAPAARRTDLLVHTLQGLLALGVQRRENILLVVEPSVAALIFYGVARLLPKSLSEGLSFSTYEPNAERLPVTLAATTFFDPFTTDVRSDLYRRRGLVINTFQDRISEAGPPPGNYARFIVETLLEEGWPTVDRLLAGFDAAGAKRPEDLELLARTHRVAGQILSASPPDDDAWRKSEVAVRYLSQEVQHQLASAPAGWPQLHKVIGTPNHLTVLELVATDRMPPEVQRPAQFLLKKFAPEKIADVVNSPLLARSAKIEALIAYVTAQGRLPDGCQLLSADGPSPRPRASAENGLLSEVLVKLPEPVLHRLGDVMDDEQRLSFFAALLYAGGNQPPPPPAIKNVVVAMIARFSDSTLLDMLAKHRGQIQAACPPPEPVLARRLGRLLYELPNHAKSFDKWLAVLGEWKASFFHPHLAERRLGEWNRFRSCLLSLREPDDTASPGKLERIRKRLRAPPRAEFKPLAEALAHAMPRRSTELDELAEVAAGVRIDMSQLKRRLELAARHAGVSLVFDDAEGAAADDELFDGPGDEVARLHRRREQQERMTQMVREVEERLLVYGDDTLGTRKLAVLQQLGQLLVGRPDFLGDGRRMIEAYFSNNGAWPATVLLSSGKTKHGFKHRGKRRDWTPYIAVGALAAVLVPLVGYFAFGGRGSTATVAKKPADDAAKTIAEKKQAVTKSGTDAAKTKPPSIEKLPASISKPAAPLADKASIGDQSSINKPKTPAASAKENASGNPSQASDEDNASAPAGGSGKPSTKPMTEGTPSADALKSKPSPPTDAPPADAEPVKKPDGDAGNPAKPPSEPAASTEETALHVIPQQDAVTLPLRGAEFSKRLLLKRWPSDPGGITLALKGIAAANDRLGGKCNLAIGPDSNPLAITLTLPNAPDKAPRTLAMLTASGGELSFQWMNGAESAVDACRALRRCVLVVIADAGTSYLSLASPISREPIGLINKLDLHSMQNNEFQFDESDDLYLGRGYVELSDSSRLPFGDRGQVAKTARLTRLPDDCAASQAQVLLWVNDKNPLSIELRLTEDTSLPDDLQPLSEEEQKMLKMLTSDLQKLKMNLDKPRWSERQETVADIESRIKSIGKALKLSKLPTVIGKPPPANPQEVVKEVRAAIIEPGTERRDGLSQRLRNVDAFRKKQHGQFKNLVTRTVKIAVTIYRRVDAETFAPCLMLGDPSQAFEAFGYEDDSRRFEGE